MTIFCYVLGLNYFSIISIAQKNPKNKNITIQKTSTTLNFKEV